MVLHWLEQSEADVPTGNQWLSARETNSLNGMRFPKRRTDWRLGRWTAKRALASCLNLPTDHGALANIEVRPAESGAPEVFLHNQPAPVAISLSHRAGISLCTVGPVEARFGCDLETVEPRGDAFLEDYFTVDEKAFISRAPVEEQPQIAALMWSAKESALKALRVGLRLDTTSVSVSLEDAELGSTSTRRLHFSLSRLVTDPDGWRFLRACHDGSQTFGGLWRLEDHVVRTVVSDLPMQLHKCCVPLQAESRMSL